MKKLKIVSTFHFKTKKAHFILLFIIKHLEKKS